MLPSIAVIPRDGSFELALLGRMRKFHESLLGLAAGRKSFALKRIEVLLICRVSSADYADFHRFVLRANREGNPWINLVSTFGTGLKSPISLERGHTFAHTLARARARAHARARARARKCDNGSNHLPHQA